VGRDLPPEQKRELEEFLSRLDAGTLPYTSAMREHVEAAAEIARRALRASAGRGAQEDLDELAQSLAAAPELPPWARGWDEPSQWTQERPPRTVNERRHQRQSSEGEKVARRWIGHPAVAREVKAAEATLRALAEPLFMYDQKTVTYVTARLLGGTAIWPDGAEWPDPFADAPAALREAAERIQPEFVGALRALAVRIAVDGAPLDPEDLAGWLVLAQITLLDCDLSRTPTEIVADLNTWPPGWIDREAATLGHVATHTSRHGRNARFQADLAASAEVVARRLGPPAIGALYAGGRRRRVPSVEHRQAARRRALAKVLIAFPDATAGKLRATWSGGPSSPGGLLRTKLGLQPHDPPPSETTLRKDLLEIG
jgi:hypothetical protein